MTTAALSNIGSQVTQVQQLERIVIDIPTTFFEVKLPEDDVEARKKALNKYNGQVILLSTEWSGAPLNMGQVRIDPQDQQCYYFREIDGLNGKLEEKRLWYNDLKMLYYGHPISSISIEFTLKPFTPHA